MEVRGEDPAARFRVIEERLLIHRLRLAALAREEDDVVLHEVGGGAPQRARALRRPR